jgi:hypothetical protein
MAKCPVDNAELEDMSIPGSPGCFKPCSTCGREWYYLGDDLASKPRKVRIVAPLVKGAKMDDCIKPVTPANE